MQLWTAGLIFTLPLAAAAVAQPAVHPFAEHAPAQTAAVHGTRDIGALMQGVSDFLGGPFMNVPDDIDQWVGGLVMGLTPRSAAALGLDVHGPWLALMDTGGSDLGAALGLSDPVLFREALAGQSSFEWALEGGQSYHVVSPFPSAPLWRVFVGVRDDMAIQTRREDLVEVLLAGTEPAPDVAQRFTYPPVGSWRLDVDLAGLVTERESDFRRIARFLFRQATGSTSASQRQLSPTAIDQAQGEMFDTLLEMAQQVEVLRIEAAPTEERLLGTADIILRSGAPLLELLPRSGTVDPTVALTLPEGAVLRAAGHSDTERNAAWITAMRVGALEAAAAEDESVSMSAVEELALMHFNLFALLGDQFALGLYPQGEAVPLTCSVTVLTTPSPEAVIDSLVAIQSHPLSLHTLARLGGGEESDLTVLDQIAEVDGIPVRHLTIEGVAGLLRRVSSAGFLFTDFPLQEDEYPDWHCWLVAHDGMVIMTHEPEPRLMGRILAETGTRAAWTPPEELAGGDLLWHLDLRRVALWLDACDSREHLRIDPWHLFAGALPEESAGIWWGVDRVPRGLHLNLWVPGADVRAIRRAAESD